MGTEIRTTSSTGGQKGVKEERGDLVPIGPLRELAVHFGRGALKYDVHQWRKGYEWSKSYSALDRHLKLFWSGEDYDVCSNEPENCLFEHPEDGRPWPKPDTDTCWNHTGSHHMVAVAWHSMVLLEFKDRHPEFDDRFKTAKIPGGTSSENDLSPTVYISYEDIIKQMHDDELTRIDSDWIIERFGEGQIRPWSDLHRVSLFGEDKVNVFADPEPLSWVSNHTGQKQPVCICSETERAEQDTLITHYRIVHGIKL